MHLPGRLAASTLGDMLGTLHRSRISGVLELRERVGHNAGRSHRIYLKSGMISQVETDAAPPPAWRLLARQRTFPSTMPESEPVIQARLEALFRLRDADIAFHITRPPRPDAPTLGPDTFLHGRPRKRDERRSAPPSQGRHQRKALSKRQQALRLLGLHGESAQFEIAKAFRKRAQALHPDRHPHASESERKDLRLRFGKLVEAYQLLIA